MTPSNRWRLFLALALSSSLVFAVSAEESDPAPGDVVATIVADTPELDQTVCRVIEGTVETGDIAEVPDGTVLVRPDPELTAEPVDLESLEAEAEQDAKSDDEGDDKGEDESDAPEGAAEPSDKSDSE